LKVVGTGGTLNLAGANTYTGPTTITGSNKLAIIPPYNTLGSVVVVSNGARLKVTANASSSVLPAITLNNGGGLEFDLGAYNPANAPAIINASLIVSGVNIIDVAGSSVPTASITLLTYTNKTGAGAFVLGTVPPGIVATLTDTGSALVLNTTDDLVLPGNIWPNSRLETDSNGNGIPDFWNRNSATFCVWTTNTSVSPLHSLQVNDTTNNNYGEWYSDPVAVQPGTSYHLRFLCKYSISKGPMQVYTTFLNSGVVVSNGFYILNGTNLNWSQVDDVIRTPTNTTHMRLSLKSAGNLPELGQIWLDDVSLVYTGIGRVVTMPRIPSPFLMRDWKVVATNYDAFVFNYGLTGDYLPLIRDNPQNPNFILPWFGLPTYVGTSNYTEPEAINAMAAILGASVVGIDKSSQNGRNWVRMMIQYFNHSDGVDVLFNNSRGTVSSFWYQLFPHILFAGLVDRYPATAALTSSYSVGGGGTSMNGIFSTAAQKWYVACQQMGANGSTPPDFNWNGFNFLTGQPFANSWVEPEGAAGVAWLEYMAWRKFGQTNANFLQAADWSLQFMQNSGTNIQYEVLMPYGALAAVRMNAELGRDYDVVRFVNWCFEGDSYARYGWGVISDKWGGTDVAGLMGSQTDGGGYAFAMNTFASAGALAPVARYDQRFAHDLGKWLLNVANNSRLFYSTYVAANHQSCPNWLSGTNDIIPYEGLRKSWNGTNLYATGDALRNGWSATDYALYGGSHVGMLAAVVGRTSDDKILQLDLLATDFFKDAAYPTYLIYNPYTTNATFSTSFGAGTNDLLDIIGERFLATNASGSVTVTVAADSAVVVVVIPSNTAMGTQDGRMFANGRIVNYRYAGLDTDNDGLPNWWESRYFGNITNASPTAIGATGYNNLTSYRLGVNPFATNVFAPLLSIQPGTGYPQLTWPTIGGKTYSVSVTDQLGAANSWTNIYVVTEYNIPVGMLGTQSYVDSLSVFAPSASNRFFRVQLQ